MRAIDADALKKDLTRFYDNEVTAKQLIDEQPTIEFEIIHCKYCNHWSRETICDGFCSEDCMRHDEDFYCGYAERRTDGQTVSE